MLGKIYITSNSNLLLEELADRFPNAKFFLRDEFKIDDVKEVIKEAYIAEDYQKRLILAAKKFNIYAQNSLLKIFFKNKLNDLSKST